MNTNTTINGAILDAFVREHPSADYDDLSLEHWAWDGSQPHVCWDDPATRHLSHSPRTYRVVSVANSYAFEEV